MKKKIKVNDKMQSDYEYFLTEPAGKNFDSRFKPELTPKQMLSLGVFGGRYMRDCKEEFPKSWFSKAKLHPKNVPGHSKELNFLKLKPLNLFLFGLKRDGFILKIQEDGFNGIVVIIWAEGQKMTKDKLSAGLPLNVMLPKLKKIVLHMILNAVPSRGKFYFIGHMILEKYDYFSRCVDWV